MTSISTWFGLQKQPDKVMTIKSQSLIHVPQQQIPTTARGYNIMWKINRNHTILFKLLTCSIMNGNTSIHYYDVAMWLGKLKWHDSLLGISFWMNDTTLQRLAQSLSSLLLVNHQLNSHLHYLLIMSFIILHAVNPQYALINYTDIILRIIVKELRINYNNGQAWVHNNNIINFVKVTFTPGLP